MKKHTIFSWLLTAVLAVSTGLAFAGTDLNTQKNGGSARFTRDFFRISAAGISVLPAKTDHSSRPAAVLTGMRRLVPQQYESIQAAINASADGDTVLVADSTYYENIDFRGKAIIVASYFLLNGDTTHIDSTVIDGSLPTHADSGSVVYFVNGEDTTSVLYGLTITGGTGTTFSRKLSNGGTAWFRAGGGIYCDSSGARLVRNKIIRNHIDAGIPLGGGIGAHGADSFLPFIIIEDNRIMENLVQGHDDVWWGVGGGVQLWGLSARINGNDFIRDSVISAAGAASGALDFQAYNELPKAHITNNVFRDNYVSAGDEGAIGAGMTLAWTDEITVENNLFENNQAVTAGTSGNGWSQGGGLCITDQEINDYGAKTIVNNLFIGNSVHSRNSANNINGGGIFIFKTTVILSGNEFADNTATSDNGSSMATGAGIGIFQSSVYMENNIIYDNIADDYGGGIDIQYSTKGVVSVINNTIFANQAGIGGGGISLRTGAIGMVMNNILWANQISALGPQIQIYSAATIYCYHNDIEGGYAGTNNLDSDPLFLEDSFSLSEESPCSGAGIDSVKLGSTWYESPQTDFFGAARPNPLATMPDIGAVEASFIVNAIAENEAVAHRFDLDQNTPNPFNPLTSITYRLAQKSTVDLSVYNLLGQKVATLVSENQPAGKYRISWDASGFASGVYIYKIQTDKGFSAARKLVLIK